MTTTPTARAASAAAPSDSRRSSNGHGRLASMTGIEGIKLPSLPNATVRRKIPNAFHRPSISIGAGYPPGEKREWRTIVAQDIATGDIVPGIGRVFSVNEQLITTPDVVWTVTVTGGVGNTRTYQG